MARKEPIAFGELRVEADKSDVVLSFLSNYNIDDGKNFLDLFEGSQAHVGLVNWRLLTASPRYFQ